MGFIRKNENIIKDWLINNYSTEELKGSSFYLTEQQVDGMLNYLDNLGNDEINNLNILAFIDHQVVYEGGFDKYGHPIEKQQEDEEETETLIQ